MDYSKYSIGDFFMDESFQDFARGTNPEAIKLWTDIIKQFPEKEEDILEAKKLIQSISLNKVKIDPKQFEEDETKIKEFLNKQEKIEHKQVQFVNWSTIKIAASITVFMVLAALFYQYFSEVKTEENTEKQTIAFIEKNVPKGQKLTLFLEDGTKVKINSNSTLKFPAHFNTDKREIFLEGEAFFEVKRDTSRPFIIQSKNIATTVLGTSFNISAYPENPLVKVAVVTGKVKVEDTNNTKTGNNHAVSLLPEEMATFSSSSGDLKKSNYSSIKEIGWSDGIIYFENTPLSEIIEMLENWYGVEIKSDNKVNTREIYTGTFKDESLENVLNALKERAKFHYSINNSKVNIYGL
ncbi:MAG: hypothetical protein CMO01_07305 [Thalassobius sp.]|nr:hypothetical protein [Thalassovita sp.]